MVNEIAGVASEKILIRPASISDAGPAVELIYLPMGRLADYLFGADDPNQAREVLGRLFTQDENRFSYRYCDVIQYEGQVAGLLLSYPSCLLGELALPMGKKLAEILGYKGMFRMLRRSMPFMKAKEAEPDEYYIFTVAVFPEFQEHGLGTHLMDLAEEKARQAGLRKCSLGVTLHNERALRFYEKIGYEIVDTIHTPKLDKLISHPGYYRLVKELAAQGSRRSA